MFTSPIPPQKMRRRDISKHPYGALLNYKYITKELLIDFVELSFLN